MTPPANQHEYNVRAQQNTKITGFGAETTTVLPCPFCAAPDWMKFPVTAGLNNYTEQSAPHTCKECGRSGRLIVARSPGEVRSELVQTGGEDPPEWLVPKPRRES